MTVVTKNMVAHKDLIRDVRPVSQRFFDGLLGPELMGTIFIMYAACLIATPFGPSFADLILFFFWIHWAAFKKKGTKLSFKIPAYAKGLKDPNNPIPGQSAPGKAEGILYLGKDEENGDELWLSNNDARTHILYLGTTGAGKTEGLKSMVANSLCWGSGFSYTDGKADTDLWASLYALARRFGRDDDLLILNYMTANSDDGAVSNTMNPFSNGSASYLTNMIVSLMPDAGGDNAMWKERAIALMSAFMPALTWKRDRQGLLLDVGVVRENLELAPIIRLSRDRDLPERIIRGLQGYLQTLPGYVDAAFDDDGNEKPPSPDQPMYDLQVARQQHGYLSMQFTRSLQSLADEYGYIFKAQLADIDMMDVVLNRRIMVVLIPALEKSGDEAANLGKIVAASIKGMMGSTLGNSVEGSWETAIESKQTRSNSSFMTVFDEVGYYTAPGMAVMAAQARSLGFSMVFAAQDLPSMEKRVKQEARSILGNCNLKIFGKLEDPTDTKDFLDKHAGSEFVYEATSLSAPTDTVSGMFFNAPYYDKRDAAMTTRQRVSYDNLRTQKEGEAYMFFGQHLVKARMFHSMPGRVKALRVHRLLPVPPTTTSTLARDKALGDVTAKLRDAGWAAGASPSAPAAGDLASLTEASAAARKRGDDDHVKAGIEALTRFALAAPAESPARADGGASETLQPIDAPMPAQAGVRSGLTTVSVGQPSSQPIGLRAGDETVALEQDFVYYGDTDAVQEQAYPALSASDITALAPPPADEWEDINLILPDALAFLAHDAANRLREGLFGDESAAAE
ncbi:MAG: TraM recognition domain-containing protein [Alphaproteobacteria bacterium]